jgi:hypothetical protein
VTVTDLNWEDKELVLRVLFSKMNGANSNLPKMNTLGPKSYGGNNNTNNMTNNNQPVFISEGANMPMGEENGMMNHFEVDGQYDDYLEDDYEEQGMQNNSRSINFQESSSFQKMYSESSREKVINEI